jgi:hypothetical protein
MVQRLPEETATMEKHKPTAEQLLREAAAKPVHGFLQFDGDHIDGTQAYDEFMLPDKDSDVLTRGFRWELRQSYDVLRVQIPEDMDKETALRLLKKISDWIETDDQALTPPSQSVVSPGG